MNERVREHGRAPHDAERCHRSIPWHGPALAVLLLLASACGTTQPTPRPFTLVLTASSGTAVLAEDLAAGFRSAFPQAQVVVEPVAGSLVASQRVALGSADLALVTNPGSQETTRSLEATQVAWDALAVIVHPDNPLAVLSLGQLRHIFSGRLQDWAELDAGEGMIQVVSREEGAGARAIFDTVILAESRLTSTALLMPDSQQMVDYVAAHRWAIGYVSATWLDARLRVLTLEGLPPDADAGLVAGYPLLMPVYLMLRRPASEESTSFVNYALSAEGQAIVDQHYGRLR